MADDLQERVRYERRVRGWSIRTASLKGGFSNTLWGDFETDGTLTATVRTGIAQAFGWSTDWPEHPPPLPTAPRDDLERRLVDVEVRLAAVEAQLAEPRSGDVIPLRPRRPDPPPAAPSQPRPKAARSTTKNRRSQPGRPTRPRPSPEPEGP